MLKNISNLGILLNKVAQKNINGGFSGNNECDITGCHERYPGGNGYVGFGEGNPCAFDTPYDISCVGIIQNGLCCIS
ncbi:hypothetical protein C7448_101366 [Tenacibaculum gallaicum]|uniref:Uncharacterized protein n=1 Tax=Tenacibaculum gallaicum TaxID=561505 RepID=A0A3E0ICQ4_9FLAO|nr:MULTISPECIES: hypothetical protein [Tenacibaculum]MDO6673992.1 hypothetical protein [Tenacibaculum sp. 1_MG-2023]MDX8552320.1 hypothetical protein [Tenacibaculum sp. 1B UA]REH56328.1 hypothetical protein C7448_101366 [Tenacibaculum gallaicum]